MIAGLPGTGIGGLFYLALALLMPLWELGRAVIGRATSGRVRLVVVQAAIALGILGAIWVTGLALSLLQVTNPASQADGAFRMLYVAPALVAFGTLAVVLAAVEIVALMLAVAARVSQLLSNETPASGGDR
jgi:hypothetical protein